MIQRMSRPSSRVLLCTVYGLCLLFPKTPGVRAADTEAMVADGRPNIVFILADDLGWSDTTLFGTTSLYETPNIERLADRGMTFTRAYASSPLCSPTRASILTGLSPARHGITSPSCHLPAVVLKAEQTTTGPASRFSTIPKSVTRLDTAFLTLPQVLQRSGYATGHFGKWHLGSEPYSPLEHGFDVDLPHHSGPGPAGSYVAPWKFREFDPDPDVPNQHIEDRMAQEAVRFMEQNRDRPFFLNYWMFSVHAPFDAKQELIRKWRRRIDPQSPQRSPTYAAMIESMDDAVGTLLDALDRLGLSENTIVVFASDNGGNMYNLVDGGTATSNAPLRGGKANLFEGGIRGPAVVVCPGVTSPGSASDELIQSVDFFPTLLDLIELQPGPSHEFDGISIVPTLRGELLDRQEIFTYFPHQTEVPDWLPPAVSVHSGKWKLIRVFHGDLSGGHRYMLYDLSTDIGEKHDVSRQHMDVVLRLDQQIEQHLENTNAVRPLPNPNFRPEEYDRSLEGQAELKGTGGGKGRQRNGRTASRGVTGGWMAGGTCQLSLQQNALQVLSTGGDPHLSTELQMPVQGGGLTLRFVMSSNAKGRGRLYFRGPSEPFALDRSIEFDVRHDGTERSYVIPLGTEQQVQSIRIDPAAGAGNMRIHSITLQRAAGEHLQKWAFPE